MLWLVACGSPPPAPSPALPTGTPPADHHDHASGTHMAAMAATRDRLRAELGPAYDQPVAGLDDADPAKGSVLYEAHCGSCHGAGGKGDGPAATGLMPSPADFTDAFHARYYSDAGRVRIIEKGSPDTAMTGFDATLDHQQILDLYAHVRAYREANPAPPDEHEHEHH